MDVGMMMVFASYGWDNCPDGRVWDEELRLPLVGRAPLHRLLVRARQPPTPDLPDGALSPH